MICPLMSWRAAREKPCLESKCALWNGITAKCCLHRDPTPQAPAGAPATTQDNSATPASGGGNADTVS